MSHLSDLHYELQQLRQSYMEPQPAPLPDVVTDMQAGRQPLAQWLNSLHLETVELVAEITQPAYRFLSKAEVLNGLELSDADLHLMARIGSRLQFIAASIDVRDPPKLTVIK